MALLLGIFDAMKTFDLNGIRWTVKTVCANDFNLVDRTGVLRVATTDPYDFTIYISNELYGLFKKRVIAHEIGHAVCFSYGILDEIHSCCFPNKVIDMEELICNFVADYGEQIFLITYDILGDDALVRLPYYLSNVFIGGQ